MRDMVTKGRSLKGMYHTMAKLTDADVLAIREHFATGEISHQALADRYNVYRTTIGKIIRRQTWRHI